MASDHGWEFMTVGATPLFCLASISQPRHNYTLIPPQTHVDVTHRALAPKIAAAICQHQHVTSQVLLTSPLSNSSRTPNLFIRSIEPLTECIDEIRLLYERTVRLGFFFHTQ